MTLVTNNSRQLTCHWLPLTLLLLCGCGDDSGLIKVSGQVTLDGKPLSNAGVMFHPDAGGIPARGTTDQDGNFVLTTREDGDGATPGQNAVTVAKKSDNQRNMAVEEGEIVKINYDTPAKYHAPQTSGIRIEVKPGMAPVTIELKNR